ncbi:MAG: ATP-binding protein [Thermoproteota archaeon]
MSLGGEEIVGIVVDNSTPTRARFVSSNPPPVGEYVTIEYPRGEVLGLVERVGTRSFTLASLAGTYDPVLLEKLSSSQGAGDVYFECSARLLGDTERLEIPRLPPLPGSRVKLAPTDLLKRFFGGPDPYYVSIGVLASRPDVEVKVSVNKLVTRHTAVLAVTGAGKSNTVAVIVDGLAKIGGTVLILDFHGEYAASDIAGSRLKVIEPTLNPWHLSVAEFMVLVGIEPHYYNQERIFRKALEEVRKSGRGPFLEELLSAVEKVRTRRREESAAAAAVANKIEALIEKYGETIIRDDAVDPAAALEIGHVNVLDLSQIDEEAADVVVSHVLRQLLHERKKHKMGARSRVPTPVLVVVEEAHILAPRDGNTLSKYWLSRIAREGRKFGLGLMLVSQRPKALDPNILSQANNLIVLRIVEPSDQRHIQEASESLSEDLVEQLPSLNTGEAVVVGPFVKLPALVKIYKYRGKLGGTDPDVVREWMKATAHQRAEYAIEDPDYESLL